MLNYDQALEADYLKFDVNEAIPIYQGDIVLVMNDSEQFDFKGEIRLDWLPSPTIKFFGETNHRHDEIFSLFSNLEKNKIKFALPNYIKCDVIISKFSSNSDGMKIEGEITNIMVQPSKKVFYIKCGIANFLNTYGEIVQYKGMGLRNRIKININEWEVIIDKRPDYSEKKINEKLKNTGGYGITHLCLIKRHDGQAFEANNILELEKALYWTLSFACGRRVGIVLLEGYNKNEVVWCKYQTPIIDKWKYRKTWFPNNEWETISKILPSIYSKLQDKYWRVVLTNTLSWYLECQSDGIIDNKIVSNQVALETLAWAYLVEDTRILKEHEYKDMRASDIFRVFFKQFCEDTAIPNEFPYLEDIRRLKYSESSHLLADFRNNIVHPKKRKKFHSLQSDFSFYILKLGLHYLELSLLFIMKYDGKYVSQLYFGWDKAYESVPWNENKSHIE
ncbi:hypothetical protein ACFOLF_06205 [Paenibacillus sepulcri]|uniref:YopA central domain-containing protein n=1 Tax=Paenibacillus sepulcri TaxID=359917 RepID=A0ABS7BXC4_9BACL|nr:hypothetical protein [Paenibacillus sepulcri]